MEVLPDEVLAEMQQDFDTVYDPGADGEKDELGPEIRLSKDQSKLAVLYYLARYVEPGTSFVRTEDTPGRNMRGVNSTLAIETGIYGKLIDSAIGDYVDRGLVVAEANDPVSADLKTALRITESGLEMAAGLEASQPEEVAMIKQYFTRHKRQDIIFVRQEIEHARQFLGEQGPCVFEDLTTFQEVGQLNGHLVRLREIQADLEWQISILDHRLDALAG